MEHAGFLQDLAVVMTAAGIVTVLCHRFKQPVVLGYVLAGMLIGSGTLPFRLIGEEAQVKTLSELGVVFLMFSLGLEFSLRKLRKVGLTAVVAASLQIVLMIWLGYETGRAFGWKPMDRIFLGAMLSVSSTTLIVKTLRDLGWGKERFAELIYGILIVQDMLAILMIALLSGVAATGGLALGEALATAARLGVFLVVAVVAGLLGAPRLVGYVARFKNDEVLLVTVLGLCFGVALLAVKLNYSVALGAFVIGAVIAEAREIGRIESLMAPLRDLFSAVFFVAIGLSINPAELARHAGPVAVISVVVVAGMSAACAFGVFIAGHDRRVSLRTGLGLAQIGEFSFIIAAMGRSLDATSPFLYPVAVGVSAVTAFCGPWLMRRSDRLADQLDRLAPARVVSYMNLYTAWVGQWRQSRHQSLAGRLVRRWAWQISLNLALVAGVFAVAGFLNRRQPAWLQSAPGRAGDVSAALWFAAVLCALPMLVAAYRKLQALGMLLAEMAAARLGGGPRQAGAQTVIAHSVTAAGTLGVALLIAALSATLLPSWRMAVGLMLAAGVVAAVLWRRFIRVYSKAQAALEDTFAQPPPVRAGETEAPLAGLLKEARIESMVLGAESPACGRLIRELAVRTQTGASIVALGRGRTNLINPGPDEELQAGDQLVVLGAPAQLEAARRLFASAPAAPY